jgi:hypothetical protein
LTGKINELTRNFRNKYVRRKCGFQKVKEHRTNFVMEEKVDVFFDYHSRQISVKY